MGRKPLILEEKILAEILAQLKEGKPQYQIAKDYNLSPMFISRLKKRVFSNNGGISESNSDSLTT